MYLHTSPYKTIVRTPSPCFIVRVPHQKKKREKKEKLPRPFSPHIHPTSPVCTFVSNANERKIQGSAAPCLRTDSSFFSSSSFITTP